MPHPRFDKYVNDKIGQAQAESSKGRQGIIMSFDKNSNKATVLLTAPDSELTGDLITNVPCPVTMGVQTTSPEPGRPCWVAFSNNREKSPMITHFWNFNFETFDYNKQYDSTNYVPRFMLSM